MEPEADRVVQIPRKGHVEANCTRSSSVSKEGKIVLQSLHARHQIILSMWHAQSHLTTGGH
eukprot:1335989-Prorocentrum_lima.AAC.1